jgi:hypothetical protein
MPTRDTMRGTAHQERAVTADEGSPGNRDRGSSCGLRTPTRNEQQIALVLLERVIVSDAARGQLEQISLGHPVREQAFALMYCTQELASHVCVAL